MLASGQRLGMHFFHPMKPLIILRLVSTTSNTRTIEESTSLKSLSISTSFSFFRIVHPRKSSTTSNIFGSAKKFSANLAIFGSAVRFCMAQQEAEKPPLYNLLHKKLLHVAASLSTLKSLNSQHKDLNFSAALSLLVQ